ncbi:MAG: cupredoxin domain-containing protein [Candidatus Gracilibacteria bacterium]|jgi:plastocyanin
MSKRFLYLSAMIVLVLVGCAEQPLPQDTSQPEILDATEDATSNITTEPSTTDTAPSDVGEPSAPSEPAATDQPATTEPPVVAEPPAVKVDVFKSVTISNFAFAPQTLTVDAGTTVTWRNDDDVPHTIVSSGLFSSATLNTGDSFSFKFETPGEYNYSCGIHPSMTGIIIVK